MWLFNNKIEKLTKADIQNYLHLMLPIHRLEPVEHVLSNLLHFSSNLPNAGLNILQAKLITSQCCICGLLCCPKVTKNQFSKSKSVLRNHETKKYKAYISPFWSQPYLLVAKGNLSFTFQLSLQQRRPPGFPISKSSFKSICLAM